MSGFVDKVIYFYIFICIALLLNPNIAFIPLLPNGQPLLSARKEMDDLKLAPVRDLNFAIT